MWWYDFYISGFRNSSTFTPGSRLVPKCATMRSTAVLTAFTKPESDMTKIYYYLKFFHYSAYYSTAVRRKSKIFALK